MSELKLRPTKKEEEKRAGETPALRTAGAGPV
jgi:hypothetical protein